MSQILLLDKLTPADGKRLLRDLTCEITHATGKARISCFREYNNRLHVPIGYDTSWLSSEKKELEYKYTEHTYTPTYRLYSGEVQRQKGIEEGKIKDQQEIYDNVLSQNFTALCLSTGFGKTKLSCMLSAHEGGRTMVICPNTDILEQWEMQFKEMGVTVGYVVNPRKKDLPDTDVLLCTVETGRKLVPDQVRDVKTLIYDEAHKSTTTAVTETLLVFVPKRLIICTATIERQDGGHRALRLYYGDNVVVRILKKNFEIVKCNTNIVPDTSKKVSIGGRSRIDYVHAMKSVNADPRYPKMIVALLRAILDSYPETDRIVVLSRENSIIDDVSALLQKEKVVHFVANKKVSIKQELGNERLIIAINKKAEEGVDIPGVKHVVTLYSSPRIQQAEGRAREDNFHFWYFTHLHRMHEKHWGEALEWCETRSMGEYKTRSISLSMEYHEMMECVK